MTIPHDTQGGRLRRPEYTGENRCVPCTIFNLVIAAAIAAVTAVAIGPPIAVIVLVGSLTAIWFRGYLVPGTPELTKRYLPNHVLSLFGKATDVGETRLSVAVPPDFDPEAYLLSAGILVETADESDLAFAPWFADAWQTALDKGGAAAENRADDDLAALATLTGIDVTTLSLDWHGASGVAFADDSVIGRWESRPAFRADVAADRVLAATRDDWADLPLAARSATLGSLRLFVDECPVCGGDVVLEERIVESCCTSRDVVAARCGGCDARLFEMDLPDSTAAATE